MEGFGGNEVGGSGGSGSGSSPFGHGERGVSRSGGSVVSASSEMPSVKMYYESPQAVSEARAVAFVEAQLGERLRDDGPILGMEFDLLPPGAFGAPIVQQNLAVRPDDAKPFDAKPVKVKRVLVSLDSESEEEHEKIKPSSIDPPMPSKSVKQVGVAIPGKVLSSQSDMICVQGYKVKNVNAPILKAIFRSHGDIAAKCVFTDAAVRTSLLEAVCEIVRRVKTNDVTNIISKMEEIERQVSAAEASKINVSWLQAHLETIRKRNEAQKKKTLLMEMKTNTTLVKMAAKTDERESYDEFVAARIRLIKAKKCVKVLELVEKKLNNSLLESKAEKDSWARQPVI